MESVFGPAGAPQGARWGPCAFNWFGGGRDGTDTVMETTPLQLHNTNVTSAKDAASTSHTHPHTHTVSGGKAQP